VRAVAHGVEIAPCETSPTEWSGRAPEPERYAARPDIKLTFVR
jgi:hypothetical protein